MESYLSGVNPAHTAVATSSNSSLQASSDVSPRLVRLSMGALETVKSQGNCTFEQVLRERDRELHERRIKTIEELIREQRARKDREQREMQEIESPQLQQLHVCESN